MDMRIPPLMIKVILESNPLKSRILGRRLAAANPGGSGESLNASLLEERGNGNDSSNNNNNHVNNDNNTIMMIVIFRALLLKGQRGGGQFGQSRVI